MTEQEPVTKIQHTAPISIGIMAILVAFVVIMISANTHPF
ncbi:hypothetical protein EQ875_03648 [Photobacterium damselae subsp. damselae]|uniref:Uncharacterized protein n=2 Tax=Photobacterium damselae TaxID=38293 RepID=D0YWT1_PHODD|nr:hypothetical protein VDA_001476 [Photobacterium damselae subsp. damselae CIP 102761]TGZ32981.1 hypothetical protein EQ875_03648 [Photobacterium damselae subsp. damselae]SPY22923.1 Uncharacterised protein [Photobacterium damselae]SPY28958.1 Uncharacterised protein [Photobacterium damselae]SUB65636.1 Uncharacterised protein [Photobacterium damselae]